MLFEVFLVYFARERPYMSAIKVVSAARKAYEELEKLEEVKTKEEKIGLEWNQNLNQEVLRKITLLSEIENIDTIKDSSKCLLFAGSVRLTEYPFTDINNDYSFDIDCTVKSDAERILISMKDQITNYGCCTITDLANIIRAPVSSQLRYFGWKDLSSATIKNAKNVGEDKVFYSLDLPEAMFLDMD